LSAAYRRRGSRTQAAGGGTTALASETRQRSAPPGRADVAAMMNDFFDGRAPPAPVLRRRQGRRRRRASVALGAEEAASGTVREIWVATTVSCDACMGRGTSPGTSPDRCGRCDGSGRLRPTSLVGPLPSEAPCPQCEGRGSVVARPRPNCDGDGQVPGERTVRFKVPGGVADGKRPRLTGQGEAGARGPQPGDLYIWLTVTKGPPG
jgi:molecular chaperone DnaJ